jgi:hypothetical protein
MEHEATGMWRRPASHNIMMIMVMMMSPKFQLNLNTKRLWGGSGSASITVS